MECFDKKASCAICGDEVKGLLPWKIDGQYVCNRCRGLVDLPDDVMKFMNVEGFKTYMAFRQENQTLREKFQITDYFDFGLFDHKFVFDTGNRLMCLNQSLTRTLFEGNQITAFEIREDDELLLEGSPAGLILHKRQIPQPFRKFYVDIHFNHPYRRQHTADTNGPQFDSAVPDISKYLELYHKSVQTIEHLANTLMTVAFPGTSKRIETPRSHANAALGLHRHP